MDTPHDHLVCSCVYCQFSFVEAASKHYVLGAASFTIYNRTKEHFRNHNYLCRNSVFDVALTGGISGAMSGALISFSSAREFPAALQTPVLTPEVAFELVKVKLASANVHFI